MGEMGQFVALAVPHLRKTNENARDDARALRINKEKLQLLGRENCAADFRFDSGVEPRRVVLRDVWRVSFTQA
jgi:hypothetical protein